METLKAHELYVLLSLAKVIAQTATRDKSQRIQQVNTKWRHGLQLRKHRLLHVQKFLKDDKSVARLVEQKGFELNDVLPFCSHISCTVTDVL